MPFQLKFGGFSLDESTYELRRGTRQVKLERLAMELLLLLVNDRNRLVTRDEIAERLWGKNVFVDSENGVNTAIRKVRTALGDDSAHPKFIMTIPGKGYRFVAPVTTVDSEPHTSGRILIAVLPFVNLSDSSGQDYFCDGLTEETIATLGATSPEQLGVIARTSSMAYRHTRKTVAQVGKELGVEYIVECSVRRDDNRFRVTAQLIRVSDQTHVWAHSYQRDAGSILDLQAELARSIATQVLARMPGHLSIRHQTTNHEAFDLYLQGRYQFAARDPNGIRRAIVLYTSALDLDPNYGMAHAGLADAYATLPITSDAPTEDCYQFAMSAASHAVENGPRSAEAHSALAACNFWLAWKWDEAIRNAKQAVELNPSYALAHFFLAHICSNLGRHDEAEQEMKSAHALDPFSVHLWAIHGQFLYQAGHYQAALEAARKALAINRNSWLGHNIVGKAQIQLGDFESAVSSSQRAFEFSGGNTEPLAFKAVALARQGLTEQARDIAQLLEQSARSRHVPPFNLALAHIGIRDEIQASRYLKMAANQRDVRLIFLAVDPIWREMNQDPTVRALWPAPQQGLTKPG